MILLDTTVLVYAVGGEHPLREPCRRIVQEIGTGRIAASTTVEVIQEFAHVRARRRGRADARALSLEFVDLLSPLIQAGESDLVRGLGLFEQYDSLGAFDAVLAAVVLGRDHLTGLMSADRGFAGITGLAHHDPTDPGPS